MVERILCAALWINDGRKHPHQPKNIEKGFVVCGRRHHNCFVTVAALSEVRAHEIGEPDQGFVTSEDRYVSRQEAHDIAYRAQQITIEKWNEDTKLYSEDLY